MDETQADAVALLALVAGQDVEPADGPGQWRIARRTAPDRVISTVDPEARHAHTTRRAYRDGYKAHVAAEPDTGLVTACDIGAGNVGDADAAPDLIADEPAGTKGTARFGAHCATCPVRSRCTTAKAGRTIVLHPHHDLLAAARAEAATDEFDHVYRQHRPMIERTIAWLTKDNNRRLRYRGIDANRLAWSHRCAAVNLRRLLALGLTHNGSWTITPAT